MANLLEERLLDPPPAEDDGSGTPPSAAADVPSTPWPSSSSAADVPHPVHAVETDSGSPGIDEMTKKSLEVARESKKEVKKGNKSVRIAQPMNTISVQLSFLHKYKCNA